MKKIIVAVLMVMSLLNFSSCAVNDVEYSYSIKDALKISTWVLDESLDVNGYWIADEKFTNRSYWIESDGQIVDSNEDDIFVFEQLKLNEVRTMAPLNYFDPVTNTAMTNLNILCEFDGIVEITTEDELIRLDYSSKNPSQPKGGAQRDDTFKNVKVAYGVFVNVCPLGAFITGKALVTGDTKIGNEYYLNVNAYNFDNEKTPVIRAQLKLVVIEDNAISSGKSTFFSKSMFGLREEERSRFLSVEVVSYEYSERYMFIDELFEEDDE